MIWVGWGQKAKLIRGGRAERRRCPQCGKTSTFHECLVRNNVSVFVLLKVWEGEHRAFMCGECQEVMDLEDTKPPELSERERAQLEREQQRQLEAAKAERAREQAAKARQVDAELEALRRKLGKS